MASDMAPVQNGFLFFLLIGTTSSTDDPLERPITILPLSLLLGRVAQQEVGGVMRDPLVRVSSVVLVQELRKGHLLHLLDGHGVFEVHVGQEGGEVLVDLVLESEEEEGVLEVLVGEHLVDGGPEGGVLGETGAHQVEEGLFVVVVLYLGSLVDYLVHHVLIYHGKELRECCCPGTASAAGSVRTKHTPSSRCHSCSCTSCPRISRATRSRASLDWSGPGRRCSPAAWLSRSRPA